MGFGGWVPGSPCDPGQRLNLSESQLHPSVIKVFLKGSWQVANRKCSIKDSR